MTEGARRRCRLALTRKNTDTHEKLSSALFSSNHWSEESRQVMSGRPSNRTMRVSISDKPMHVERLAQELAAHLVLTRPLVCVDLEATGIWPGHDRIVQIATASIFPDGSVSTWSSLVNPERSIPPAVTAIHGITDAAVASAPTFAQLAPTVAARLSDCDLTGYNVARFDRRLLAAECGRVGVADPTAGARVIDAYALFVRQERRSLDDALRFYGVPAGTGHSTGA